MSAPIILCDTAGMTNERWLECRAHGPKGTIPYTVGGSDVAAIFGVSPWTTPLELWMIKKGRMKAPVKPNQEQLMMGHLLEPIAAYWYQQKTGNTVYDDTYMYQHADHPWALADFDRRFTRKEDNAPGILECKSCTYHKAGDWADDDALIARLDVQGSIPKPEHIPMPVVAEVPPTDIASRSDTYTGLLSKLTLASDHRQNLRNRGLSDEEIDRLEYRTTPVVGMQTIARQLQSSGYYLSGVPGFYRKDGKWSFACESRGILIPVRDSKGRIQGMQIRRDNAARRKFRWVSSTGRTDGCKAEGWVHIAGKPRNMVLLTEGPMKADVIHYLTGQTVLAVAGVNSLTQLELILPQLHEQGVERIMTAFDMDFMENPHVQGGYRTLVSLLSDAGFRYGTYLWDPRYKGLDDYVWEHCFQRQLS